MCIRDRVTLDPIPGGYSAHCGDKHYDIVSDWLFRELVFRGTCNGKPFCMQVERDGLAYRISHYGKQVKAVVMTPKADLLLARMPVKLPPDLSKFLLSPMPVSYTHLDVYKRQVLTVSALAKRGIPQFWAEIERYRETMSASGEFVEKRRRQAVDWMWSLIDSGLRHLSLIHI